MLAMLVFCATMTMADSSDNSSRMPTITTVAQVKEAINHPRAVLFIDVDWSIQSRLARQLVYPPVRQRSALADPAALRFFRIDATEQEGEVFEWLCSNGLKDVAYWGAGSLVFVSSGKVVDRVVSPSQYTAESLWEHIERLALDPLSEDSCHEKSVSRYGSVP